MRLFSAEDVQSPWAQASRSRGFRADFGGTEPVDGSHPGPPSLLVWGVPVWEEQSWAAPGRALEASREVSVG